MTVAYQRFVRANLTGTEAVEVAKVDALAGFLRSHLVDREAAIDAVHVYGGQSSAVQDILAELFVTQLSYLTEQPLNVDDIKLLSKSRPDFTLKLSETRGVLVEVERGGTVNNNHDLKDFWKTHLAARAHHLFLVVPNRNVKEDGSNREAPFARTVARLGLFFDDPRREVDVISCHIFGYGRND